MSQSMITATEVRTALEILQRLNEFQKQPPSIPLPRETLRRFKRSRRGQHLKRVRATLRQAERYLRQELNHHFKGL